MGIHGNSQLNGFPVYQIGQMVSSKRRGYGTCSRSINAIPSQQERRAKIAETILVVAIPLALIAIHIPVIEDGMDG